jgi:hypothetical protein
VLSIDCQMKRNYTFCIVLHVKDNPRIVIEVEQEEVDDQNSED